VVFVGLEPVLSQKSQIKIPRPWKSPRSMLVFPYSLPPPPSKLKHNQMDFGASAVWGDAPSLSGSTQTSSLPTQISLFAPPKDDPFDDFNDFGDAKEADSTQNLDDDDFGDFGDFAEQPVATIEGGQDDNEFGFPSSTLQETPLEIPWRPLRLDPMPGS